MAGKKALSVLGPTKKLLELRKTQNQSVLIAFAVTKSDSSATALSNLNKKMMNAENKLDTNKSPFKVDTKSPLKNHTPSSSKRVSGDGFYKSGNGKTTTCHQCRHNRGDSLAVWCTGQVGNSRCSSMYCHRCLLNRYDEKAEEIVDSGKWSCPKCRDICNCSVCMKRKGLEPIGIIDKEKTAGFTCVSDIKKKSPTKVKSPLKVKKAPESSFVSDMKKVEKATEISPTSDIKKSPLKVKKSPLKVENAPESSSVSDMKKSPLKVKKATEISSASDMKKAPLKVKKSPLKVKKATESSSVSDMGKNSPLKVKEAIETKSPHVNLTPSRKEQVSAGQVYNSGSGKTINCHQCQHKQNKGHSLSVWCTNQKGGKRCGSMYCNRCLMNRYGEEAEEVVASGNWSCPRCRGICNCSVCMKRSGNEPTGILIHKAKSAGFSCVSDMLVNASKVVSDVNTSKVVSDVNTSKVVSDVPIKRRKVDSDKPIKRRKVDSDKPIKREKVDSDKPIKRKKVVPDVFILLEEELTRVAGIDIPSEDVGKALQFLEFCAVFGKILDFKKGEPEYILQDLTKSRGKLSATVQFQIYLLRILQKERGQESAGQSSSNLKLKSSWFDVLKKCLSESQSVLKAQGLEFLDNTADYETLDTSKRLILLNMLCDEVLGTRKVRDWLDRNGRVASLGKGKSLKQTRDHDIDDATIRGDTLRIEPVFVQQSGYAFWKLNAFGKSHILCQNFGKGDRLNLDEKWSSIDAAGADAIEKLSFKGDIKLGVPHILQIEVGKA